MRYFIASSYSLLSNQLIWSLIDNVSPKRKDDLSEFQDGEHQDNSWYQQEILSFLPFILNLRSINSLQK